MNNKIVKFLLNKVQKANIISKVTFVKLFEFPVTEIFVCTEKKFGPFWQKNTRKIGTGNDKHK